MKLTFLPKSSVPILPRFIKMVIGGVVLLLFAFVSGIMWNRWGQLAVSLDGLNRLIFEPNHDERPTNPEGVAER